LSQKRIKAPKQKPMWKARVAIVIPNNRPVEGRFTQSLSDLVTYSAQNDIATFGVPIRQMPVVHWARNAPMAGLIKSGKPFTHVLMIDDDIIPRPDDLVKLVSHGVDIVGALCVSGGEFPKPTARVLVEGKLHELWSWPEGLVEVEAIGTGMVLLSLNAIQKVADSYFACDFEKDVYGVSDEWVEKHSRLRTESFDASGNAYWFRFLMLDGVNEHGEDIGFCRFAKKYCGLKIHVDTTVTPGHMKPYEFTVADALVNRDAMIAAAKKAGRLTIKPMEAVKAKEEQVIVVTD
jgi:hypothetical protein